MVKKAQTKKSEFEIESLSGLSKELQDTFIDHGFSTLNDIALTTAVRLSEAVGVSESKARELIIESRKLRMKQRFESCSTWFEREQSNDKISTGSKNLDELLNGGIFFGKITEVFGEHASGKSQLGYQLAVNNYIKDNKAHTIVLDTELRFSASRIVQIAEARKLEKDKVEALLDSVKKVQIMDTDDLVYWVENIGEFIKQGNNVKLVIIDSLMAPFRAEFKNRGDLAVRQQKIGTILQLLNKMSKAYGFAVYLTNHVMTAPDQFFGDPTKHLGGNVVGHFTEVSIYIRKGKRGMRIAKLVDSADQAEGEVAFSIVQGGISD